MMDLFSSLTPPPEPWEAAAPAASVHLVPAIKPGPIDPYAPPYAALLIDGYIIHTDRRPRLEPLYAELAADLLKAGRYRAIVRGAP